jgi:hypothetical protein
VGVTFNLDLPELFSFECYRKLTHDQHLLLSTLFPLAALPLLAAGWVWIDRCVARRVDANMVTDGSRLVAGRLWSCQPRGGV